MGKKKALKKLTPLGRMGRLWRESELLRKHEGENHRMYRDDVLRESTRKDALLQDKNAALARQDDLLSRAREDIAAARAERDRLIRMVDQFTSVQILGHGQVLTPHTMATPQQPGALRRA